jgi:nucleotide-binding universal stress UspA family protein
MKTILVAVDLSDVTMKVVKVAVYLAKPFQSKIILMHAIERLPHLSAASVDPAAVAPLQEQGLNFTDALGRLREMISLVGLDSITVEMEGPPVDVILAQAENSRVDLIVLGSHNHGLLHNLFTGSVVDGILQRAKCPVLVVPLQNGSAASV